MKKSELRQIIRESLREIMREEENDYTSNSSFEEVTYEIITKDGEVIKPKVKNEIQKVTTELALRYPELEAKLAKHYVGNKGLEQLSKLGIRAKHAFDEISATTFGTKEKLAKIMKYNKLIILCAGLLGIGDKLDLKAIETIKTPLETSGFLTRWNSRWRKLWGDNVDITTNEIYGDGEPFFSIAISLIVLQFIFKLIKTQKPSVPKPGLLRRMAKGVKNLFKEEIETNEIEDFMDSFIDGYTDDILKKLKTI